MMESIWLPLIGAFILGVVSTGIVVLGYLRRKKKKAMEQMGDLMDMEVDTDDQ